MNTRLIVLMVLLGTTAFGQEQSVCVLQAGNSFMETTNIVLPHTRIAGSISNSKQILFKNDSALGRILKPDYEMGWNDFRHFDFDKNAEILKALEIIENETK